MRSYITIYLLFILFSLNLFAEETTEEPQPIVETTESVVVNEDEVMVVEEEVVETTQETKSTEETPTPSISTLIEEIKSSKSEDRRELMNQLKVELRAMNKERRQETMRELKKSFAKSGQGQHRQQNLEKEHPKHQLKFRQLQGGGQGHGGGQK